MKRYVKPFILLMFIIMACANITVNVFFPEEDVKTAFDELENKYIGPSEDTRTVPAKKGSYNFNDFFISSVYAKTPSTIEPLAKGISKNKKAIEAYKRRSKRYKDLRPLFQKGMIGENREGKIEILTDEDKIHKGLLRRIRDENKDRDIIIETMVDVEKNLAFKKRAKVPRDFYSNAIAKNRKIFSKARYSHVAPGWWIKNERGKWVKKK